MQLSSISIANALRILKFSAVPPVCIYRRGTPMLPHIDLPPHHLLASGLTCTAKVHIEILQLTCCIIVGSNHVHTYINIHRLYIWLSIHANMSSFVANYSQHYYKAISIFKTYIYIFATLSNTICLYEASQCSIIVCRACLLLSKSVTPNLACCNLVLRMVLIDHQVQYHYR